MNRTSIEWTHREATGGPRGGFTWNPIRARLTGQGPKVHSGTFCTRISPGCKNCYASAINKRFGTGAEYTVPKLAHHEFYIDRRILDEPGKRKKPATIFVGDMFDLFHEAIPEQLIVLVLEQCAQDYGHTFQILTKRADRMKAIVKDFEIFMGKLPPWMWFGVSVEDQQRADERIPRLQETPATVRFLSVEPLLESVRLGCDTPELGWVSYLKGIYGVDPAIPGIDWVICGGESGLGARPFALEWASSLLLQCRNASVPFFMKQIGAAPFSSTGVFFWQNGKGPRDRKGGDPAEWPEHLRVREFPR